MIEEKIIFNDPHVVFFFSHVVYIDSKVQTGLRLIKHSQLLEVRVSHRGLICEGDAVIEQ